jgi:glutathione synthase/RimK-type ligase-like ATP-grasp enzyme
MKKIGLLFGMEQSFPPALVEEINRRDEGVSAEFCKIGGITLDDLFEYDVILDRISQDVPFYRAMLKVAALNGVRVVNNPFWWTADDKFFNYAVAQKAGIPVPKTVLLPSKNHPPETTAESFRNLMFPLNWQEIFDYVGFPSWLKPYDGGGWRHVYKVNSIDEFFERYSETADIVMTLQEGIEFTEYYRCYCIGRKHVHIMPYEPRNPHHLRYQAGFSPTPEMTKTLTELCLKICNILGYDFNTIEFAVRDGIPYAIDYMNPAPDAERTSVQEENFEWVLNTTASFLIELAKQGRSVPKEYAWSNFLNPGAPKTSGKVK